MNDCKYVGPNNECIALNCDYKNSNSMCESPDWLNYNKSCKNCKNWNDSQYCDIYNSKQKPFEWCFNYKEDK